MAYGDNYALKNPSEFGKKSKHLLNKRIYGHLVSGCRNSPAQVLEIGVGHGFFAKICRDSGSDFFGVEPNTIMYDSLLEQNYSVKQASCPPIPYESEQFDLVYSGYVLEYLKDPFTAYDFIHECHRVLRPGGILGVVFSDYMKMGKEFWNVAYMVSFVTTDRRVRQLVFDNGFTNVRSIFFAGNLFGTSRYLAYIFYKFYNYKLLSAIFSQRSILDSRFYKFRVTFPEGVLIIGKK